MRIVIKVGTTVLTLPNGDLDHNFIQDLTKQIASLQSKNQVLLVTSGAVGAGRAVFGAGNIKNTLFEKQILASMGQSVLMRIYADFFWQHKVLTAQLLLKRIDFENRATCLSIRGTLDQLLKRKILPIINENDAITIKNPSFGDNDHLAALSAVIMEAERLIILSDVAGLYDRDPKKEARAKLIKEVVEIDEGIFRLCQKGSTKTGIGGMKSKVKAAQLAVAHGIHTVISAGKDENSVLKSLGKNPAGTLFLPSSTKRPKLLKSWIKNIAKRHGTLKIDQGAKSALQTNRSLLAVGVKEVRGDFRAGDVLVIEEEGEATPLGVGKAELSHFEMAKVLTASKTDRRGCVFIHKDHLFLY